MQCFGKPPAAQEGLSSLHLIMRYAVSHAFKHCNPIAPSLAIRRHLADLCVLALVGLILLLHDNDSIHPDERGLLRTLQPSAATGITGRFSNLGELDYE